MSEITTEELRTLTGEELVNTFMSVLEDAHGVRGTRYTPELRTVEAELRRVLSPSPPLKEALCEKCGGDDIHTRYTTVGGMLGANRDRLGQPRNHHKEEATEECLYRHCRTCSWWWTTPVRALATTEDQGGA